jgi:hypothetical protein
MTQQETRTLHMQIPVELHDELNRLIPRGGKTQVITSLLEHLCELLKGPEGRLYLGLLLQGEVSLKKFLEAQPKQNNGTVS